MSFILKPKITSLLRSDTIIEVIRIRGNEIVKKEMPLSEWETMKKRKDYQYIAFQKGFSQYKLTSVL